MPHEATENAAGVRHSHLSKNARKVGQAWLRRGRKKELNMVGPPWYSRLVQGHHFCRASASASQPRRSLSDGMLDR
jgi:hypothetical protein